MNTRVMGIVTTGHLVGEPIETNAIGVEIQEFLLPAGWVGIEPLYKTHEEAYEALAKIKDDGIERRVYVAVTEQEQH